MAHKTDRKNESISIFGVVLSDSRRFAQIAATMREFGLGNIVQIVRQSIAGRSFSSQDVFDGFDHNSPDFGEKLRSAIENLGVTYIKFGQMLSTRYDILPKEIIAELSKLQDGSPTLPFETIESILNDAYGDYRSHFASIEPTPIGAASIAQVHRAVLLDQTPVVIKIQRPGLLPLIRSDIDILMIFAKALDASIEELAYFDLPQLVTDFENSIIAELNFDNERSNIAYFAEKYADRPEFVFPSTFDELCRSNILVMRELTGKKITSIEPDTTHARQMADAILTIAFDMVFRDGVFHGDPHPGNVFALDDGKIGLIDFGLVGTFTARQRQHFMYLVLAMQYGDYPLAARTLLALGHATRRVILKDLEAEIARILQKYLKTSLQDVDISSFANDFIAAGQKFGIQIPSEFTTAIRALINIEGIISYLHPHLNLIDTLTQFARNVLSENLKKKELANQVVQDFLGVNDFLRSLSGHAAQLMQDLEHDGIAIRVNPQSINTLADAVNILATRLALSIMLAALTLCLFFAKWMIPFYTLLAASFIWIAALVLWHIKAIRKRRKVKISPLLSNMKRRMRWF